MKEIEILVEVLENKDIALQKLSKFKKIGEKKVIDVYFFDPKRDDLQANKKNELDRCFRLRQKDDQNYLTYKIDHFDENNKWTYSDEHEVGVSSFKETQQIIKLLGLLELIRIENIKHTYKTDIYEIVLEEVKNLGLFLEVEYLGNHRQTIDVLKIKKEIWKFIENLGFKTSLELNVGKPELMLKNIKS